MKGAVSARNQDLDIIKGIMVFIMILYHCASIARSNNPELGLVTNFVSFIHSAFIIITGFLCSWYYLPKSQEDMTKIHIRLQVRAIKTLVIMIVANGLLYITGIFNISKLTATFRSFSEFVILYVVSLSGNYVAFEILLPISIFLFIASFLIQKYFTLSLTIILITIAAYLGQWSVTSRLIVLGGIGLVIGIFAQQQFIQSFFIKQININMPLVLLFCVLGIAIIRIYNNILSYYFIRILETPLWFAAALIIVKTINRNCLTNMSILWGQYTLLAYITQILIIRIIYIIFKHMHVGSWIYYISAVLLSTLFLSLFLKILHVARSRFPAANTVYRFVFQ